MATATYSGDINYEGGSGSDTTAVVGKAASTTTVTSNVAGVVTGGNFTFTAAVAGAGVTPTGTVTWAVSGPTTVTCHDVNSPRGHLRCHRGHRWHLLGLRHL